MNLEDITLSKISQSQKNKYSMIFTYMRLIRGVKFRDRKYKSGFKGRREGGVVE